MSRDVPFQHLKLISWKAFEVCRPSKPCPLLTMFVLEEWIYVMMTFKKDLGVLLYYDAQLRGTDNKRSPVPFTHPVDTNKNFLIGRNIESQPYQYAAFDMASLTVFEEYLHEDNVNRAFLFFWSGSKWNNFTKGFFGGIVECAFIFPTIYCCQSIVRLSFKIASMQFDKHRSI
jgi:hypothetical protein